MSRKGMFIEDPICQSNEFGLFPIVGDGEPAEVFKQGNDMNRCFTQYLLCIENQNVSSNGN